MHCALPGIWVLGQVNFKQLFVFELHALLLDKGAKLIAHVTADEGKAIGVALKWRSTLEVPPPSVGWLWGWSSGNSQCRLSETGYRRSRDGNFCAEYR